MFLGCMNQNKSLQNKFKKKKNLVTHSQLINGSWHGWVDQNLAKENLAQSPFCKLYNVHNVDT